MNCVPWYKAGGRGATGWGVGAGGRVWERGAGEVGVARGEKWAAGAIIAGWGQFSCREGSVAVMITRRMRA